MVKMMARFLLLAFVLDLLFYSEDGSWALFRNLDHIPQEGKFAMCLTEVRIIL
jgi:hypothetical protein